jgi:hypothetical protein
VRTARVLAEQTLRRSSPVSGACVVDTAKNVEDHDRCRVDWGHSREFPWARAGKDLTAISVRDPSVALDSRMS